jgi:hypothetical protein
VTINSDPVNGKPRTDFLVFAAYFGWGCLAILIVYYYFISGFTEKAYYVQVYWQTDSAPGYSEASSSVQCGIRDSEWHTYRFFLGDDLGEIPRLRLDFVRAHLTAASVEVRNLKLAYARDDSLPVAANMMNLNCTACRFSQNTDRIYIDEIEFDPFIEFDFELASEQVDTPDLGLSSESDPDFMREVRSEAPLELVELDMRIDPRKTSPISWLSGVLGKSILYSECGLVDY